MIFILKNSVFLCRVKIPLPTIFNFSQFHKHFQKQSFAGVAQNRRSKKKSLQHRYFPVNIAKFLKTAFLQNFSGGCFCIILKVIKQLFRKDYF